MGFGQEMDGCGRCMKIGLFATNACTLVGGLVTFAVSVWILADRTYMNELLATNLYPGTIYILVAMGCLAVVASLFGCLGAVKEIKCLLLTYNIVALIIFVTVLVGGILGFVFREKVRSSMEQDLQGSLKYYGNRGEYTDAWDRMQEKLECCGIRSHLDWQEKIPSSCCKEILPGRDYLYGNNRLSCEQNPSPITIHQDGCLDRSVDFMTENGVILGTVGLVMALLTIFGIVFSCALFMKIE